MTDNEIAKGFNACFFKQSCKGCHYRKICDGSATCLNTMLQDTFSLIKRQKAEIERLEKELQITRAYIHDNGLEWYLLSKNKKAKSKCDCYHTITKRRYTYNPTTGQPIVNDIEVGVCWGTKECDECSCNGNENKCDFYPQKRNGR